MAVRLVLLGSTFLEFTAEKGKGRPALGMARIGRIAIENDQRESQAAQLLKAPLT